MNSLLNLPTDHFLANVIGLLICLGIMITCICRINILEGPRWRLSAEQMMLLAFSFWAAGTFADLWHGRNIGYHGAAVGLGIVIYLVSSYRQWQLQQALFAEARAREALERRSRLHVVTDVEEVHANSTRC